MPTSWTSEPGGPLFCPDLSTIIVFSNSQAEISWSLLISQQYGLGNVEQSSSALKRIWEISMLQFHEHYFGITFQKLERDLQRPGVPWFYFLTIPGCSFTGIKIAISTRVYISQNEKAVNTITQAVLTEILVQFYFFFKIKRLEKIVVKISPE